MDGEVFPASGSPPPPRQKWVHRAWFLLRTSNGTGRPLPFIQEVLHSNPSRSPPSTSYLFQTSLKKRLKGRGMIYANALHKKVINANSGEEIASTDGISPSPVSASGCADGNYGMYLNSRALGSAKKALWKWGAGEWPCLGPWDHFHSRAVVDATGSSRQQRVPTFPRTASSVSPLPPLNTPR